MFRVKSFIVSLVLFFNCFLQGNIDAGENKTDSIKMFLAPVIYLAPKQEMNIYFENIVLAKSISNLSFKVDCKKGRHDELRWRYTPTEKDAGEYDLTITVYDESDKELFKKSTRLIVSGKMTKAPKDASVLIIGDSLTNSTVYPREIYNLFITNDKLELNMIGSHSGGGKIDEKIKHEGRGGWTWASYCSRWSEGEGYKAKSPFLVLKDKKTVIDFPAYYSKYAEGKAPEIITIMLGINDVFRATDSDVEERINNILATAKKFLGEMRKASPESIIGIALITPPAATQTAFGSNYKCKYRRWQFRKNQHRLNEVYQNEFGGREKENIYLIPAYLNIDTRNNFPTRLEPVNARSTKKVRLQSNGVHPARPGYYQIADTFYGWMRYILTKKYEK